MGELKNFAKKTFGYQVIEQIISKSVSILTLYLLTTLLPLNMVGYYGLALSYLLIIAILAVSPETIILRDYHKIKKDLAGFLNIVIYYLKIKTAIIVPIAGIVGVFLAYLTSNIDAGLFYFCFAIATLFAMSFANLKDILYLRKKEKEPIKITLVYSGIFLISALSLIVFKSLAVFGAGVFLASTCALGFSIKKVKQETKKPIKITEKTKKEAKRIFKTYGIWSHINGNSTAIMYKIDPAILYFFVSAPILGLYSIALSVINYFIILPSLMQKTLQMSMASERKKERVNAILHKSIIYFFGLSMGQFVFFLLLGKIIMFYFVKENIILSQYVYILAVIILGAVSLLNLFRPYIAYATRFVKQKHLFFKIYAPATIISLIIYIIFISKEGAVGAAFGNIASYFVFSLLLLYMYRKINKGKADLVLE